MKSNVVKIKETELINLIDKIVSEAVKTKKAEWLNEQKNKSTKVLEETIKNIVKTELNK